jgi:hypothetical protein
MLTITVTIFCWAVAVVLLRLAYKAFDKDKMALTATLASLAAFFALCGLPTFQGLAETWLQSAIYSKLTALGEQVNSIQDTTGKMQTELGEHQKKIDTHQKELEQQQGKIRDAQSDVSTQQRNLTNQVLRLSTLQSELATAQSNIIAQQTRINNVQYLVDNLFSKMTYETFTSADTNRFITSHPSSNLWHICLKLQYSPLPGSVQLTVTDPSQIFAAFPRPVTGPIQTHANVLLHGLVGIWDVNKVVYNLQYVRDERVTNLSQRIEFKGNELFIDGQYTPVQDKDH